MGSAYTNPLLILDVGSENREVINLPIHLTSACVASGDIDNDGDEDLFFGAKAQPRSYGAQTRSYLLINEGNNKFVDKSNEIIPVLDNLGMIKDADVIDFDSDGDLDIVVAEEWGGIYCLRNNGTSFEKDVIFDNNGWWNFVELNDLDKDGDLDIIAGNLGSNSRFKVTEEEPVRMYYNDFDDNGSYEQILTYYLDGREVPFSNFKEITKNIPEVKKRFLYAKDFASATLEDLFTKEKLKSSKVYKFNFPYSIVIENQGDNKFLAHELPSEVQYSPMMCAQVLDFNKDGIKDIFLGGNYYDANVQMGRYDASYGEFLKQSKDFNFSRIGYSGIKIKHQVREVEEIQLIDGKSALILAKNNEPVQLVTIKEVNGE